MRKITVNGNTTEVRTLSPFAYKDTIKSLDKSSESRVTLDGTRMPQSCVTGGRDVKSGNGGMKYHLYFYTNAAAAAKRDIAAREFLPITAEEYRAYKNDPGYMMELTSVTVPADMVAPAGANRDPSTMVRTVVDGEPVRSEATVAEAAEDPTTRKAKRK